MTMICFGISMVYSYKSFKSFKLLLNKPMTKKELSIEEQINELKDSIDEIKNEMFYTKIKEYWVTIHFARWYKSLYKDSMLNSDDNYMFVYKWKSYSLSSREAVLNKLEEVDLILEA